MNQKLSTKQESLEYLIVTLEDMISETKKIMHKDNYQKYSDEIPDLGYLKEASESVMCTIEEVQQMFENTIPEEVKKIHALQDENDSLKNNVNILRIRVIDLEKEIEFSRTFQE